MAPMYYRGAKMAIIVFDVTKEDSLEKIDSWHKDLIAYAEPNVAISVAANKADQPHPHFNEDEARERCKRLGVQHFFLTSAFTGRCVDELFMQTGRDAVLRNTKNLASTRESSASVVALDSRKRHRSCC